MLAGLGIIVIMAIVGGIVAYIGDKLGTKVGKRRMSLFGLRPKYTSIIVTIITGVCISGITMGVLALASKNVRTALFGMDQLRAQMSELNSQIADKNKLLLQGKSNLDAKVKELNTVSNEVKATKAELEEAREARNKMAGQLVSVQQAFNEANEKLAASDAKLAKSDAEIQTLEATKEKMTAHIQDLQMTTKQLEEGVTYLREGTVVFRVGETLSAATIKPGLTETEAEVAITNILNDTNGMILRRFKMQKAETVVYVSRSNLEEAAQKISASSTPMMLRIVAAGNIISGEPAMAEIQVYPYTKIYSKGDVVASTTVTGGQEAQEEIMSFLKQVNTQATAQGVISDSLSGDIGTISGNDLFAVIRQLQGMSGKVQVVAIAKEDTYTSGPLPIELVLRAL